MTQLTGKERLSTLVKKWPQINKVMTELAIENCLSESIENAAKKNGIPIMIALNSIAQSIGAEVIWKQEKQANLKEVKKILGFYSGKGGVGKTTCAVGFALKAAKMGYKVGLMDLDIDCPNVLKLMGAKGRHHASDKGLIEPLQVEGVKVISMAAIVENETEPVLWRGPILAKAVQQLLNESYWGKLDVLVIDFPPGTSDIPLTAMHQLQKLQMVMVTTPQELSILDTQKSIAMCRSMNVPVIGVIENMTGELFGQRGSKNFDLKFYSSIAMSNNSLNEGSNAFEKLAKIAL